MKKFIGDPGDSERREQDSGSARYSIYIRYLNLNRVAEERNLLMNGLQLSISA